MHVVLRGGGALASIDPAAGAVLVRRDVCGAPRGVAYDTSHDFVVVACTDHVQVLDAAHDGAALGQLQVGAGIDNRQLALNIVRWLSGALK